jgi:hypothetical protein
MEPVALHNDPSLGQSVQVSALYCRNFYQPGLITTRGAFPQTAATAKPRSPFDKPVLSEVEGLKANQAGAEIIGKSPFVLSLSKHERSPDR